MRQYAGRMVRGPQGDPGTKGFLDDAHVLATAKHFIGDGGTEQGVDRGDNLSTERQLLDIHGQGYVTALRAGVQTLMVSYISWRGWKMHGHKYLITDVLKGRMGFNGLVVTDWNGIDEVQGRSKDKCAAAVNAGIDLFRVPKDWRSILWNTIGQVTSGEFPQARIDDAVSRILRVKLRALLKNRGVILPLDPAKKVLVAGDGADNIGKQSGGWTISWQGTGNTNADFPGATSIYTGIRAAVEASGGKATLNVGGSFKEKPDVAIVVFGGNPYAEYEGNVKSLDYADDSNPALLTRLKSAGVPVVAVFLTGRPLWVNLEINASDAFVVAWLPATGSED